VPNKIVVALLALLGGTGVARAACDPATCSNLVFDGDSISAGAGATPGHGLDSQVVAALGGDFLRHNVAVGGRPVFKCLALYDQTVSPLFQPSSRQNVIVFHAGDNDMSAGRTATQTYAAFTDYTARAHKQGWKIVVSTELRRPNFSPPMEQQLELYNQLLVGNAAGADAVVNLDTNPAFIDLTKRSDPAIFTHDHVHPSDGGYKIMAAMLAPAIKTVLVKP
jgi:lysophospholipase L1-like esterase